MIRFTLFTLVLLSLMPSLVVAQSDSDRARQHFDAGTSYYDQARYEDAAREFSEAYRLSERPHLLKNVARSLENADDFTGAIDALEEYLERLPAAEDRLTIEERIEQLEDREQDRLAQSAAQDTAAPQSELPGEEESSSGDSGGISVPGIILLSSGAALGVGALITGIMAHGDHSDLTEMCTGGVCSPGLEDTRDRGETLALVSTILTGAAVVSAATGLALVLFTGGESPDDAQAEASPMWLDGGAGVSVDGRF